MSTPSSTTQPAAPATGEVQPPAAIASHAPQVTAPASAQPIPPMPLHAPAVSGDQDSVYVLAQPQGQQQPTPRQSAPQRSGAGVPAGPLLLSLGNVAGLVGTTSFYAGGVPGLAAVGAVAGVGGALRTAYAFRRVSRSRGYGYGRRGAYGGLWGARRRGAAASGWSGSSLGSTGTSRTGGAVGERMRSPFLGKQARRAAAEAGTTASGFRPGAAGSWPGSGTTSGLGSGPGAVRLDKNGQAPFGAAPRTGGQNTARGSASAVPGAAGRSSAAGNSPRAGQTREAGGGGGVRGTMARHVGAGSRAGQSIAAARRRAAPVIDKAGHTATAARRGIPAAIGKAGSAAAQTWKGRASERARSRRGWRRWARLTRKRFVSFGLAVAAGVLVQAFMPWKWGAGWRAGIRVWNWRANRSRAREDVRDAKNAQDDAKKDAKASRAPRGEANDPGAQPDSTAAPAAPTDGGSMSDQVFARAAEAVATAYGQYSPPSMMAVAAEYEGLPDGIRHAASALAHLALNTREQYPAHTVVAEAITGVCATMMAAAIAADEVAPAFRHLHADDIARHLAPRNGYNGEVMWNIGGRPGDGGTTYQSVFARSAEEVSTVYSKYQPTVMTEVQHEYSSLPDGLEHLAAAVKSLAVRSADSYAVDPQIAEMVGTVHHRLMQAVSAAQDVLPVFRRAHAKDLARHEAPRNGHAAEAMWNV